MGGKVLQLESERIEKRGIRRGIKLGEERGIKLGEERGDRTGSIRTTVEVAKDYGAEPESVMQRLMEKFGMTRKEAQESVEKYWG